MILGGLDKPGVANISQRLKTNKMGHAELPGLCIFQTKKSKKHHWGEIKPTNLKKNAQQQKQETLKG